MGATLLVVGEDHAWLVASDVGIAVGVSGHCFDVAAPPWSCSWTEDDGMVRIDAEIRWSSDEVHLAMYATHL